MDKMSSSTAETPSCPTTTIEPFMYCISVVQGANCSFGLLLNGFLLYTIFRNKKLRTSCCSLFIMLLASFDWLTHFSIATLPTILTLAGATISVYTCFWVGSYGNYIYYNMIIMMLTISIDRLASVSMPIKYKFLSRRYKWNYVLVVVLLPAVGLLPVTLYQYFIYSTVQPNLQVYCQPSDMMGPSGKNYGFLINVWANVATVLVYLCIFLLLKCKVVKIWHDKVDQHLSKSLFVLMSITLFFVLPAPLFVQYILPTLKITDDKTSNSIYRAVLQLSKFTQAMNGPVLYFCSADYRLAIRREWANLFGGSNSASVQVVKHKSSSLSSRAPNLGYPTGGAQRQMALHLSVNVP